MAVIAGVTLEAAGLHAAPSSHAALPAKLVGRWTRLVTASDVERANAPGIRAGSVWTFTVKRSGAAAVGSPGIATFSGRIVPAGADLVHIKLGFGSPIGFASLGLYKWRAIGEHLTVVKVRDPIADRVAVFSGSWSRK
jgi:hypothetical protein